MRMTRLYLIKQFSVENDPDWPDRNLQYILDSEDEIGRILSSPCFYFK